MKAKLEIAGLKSSESLINKAACFTARRTLHNSFQIAGFMATVLGLITPSVRTGGGEVKIVFEFNKKPN
jgi:hypothetical protein